MEKSKTLMVNACLQAKKKSKQENKDKPKQTPKTIENCRVIDETFIGDIQNDPELQLDLKTDEISEHLAKKVKANEDADVDLNEEDNGGEENKEPKILITTSELKISLKTYKLCRELTRVLPNAHYFYRKNIKLKKVIPEAIKRNYSAFIVINEDRRVPSESYSLTSTGVENDHSATLVSPKMEC